MEEPEGTKLKSRGWFAPRREPPVSLGLLIFVFGTVAGFMLAFAGLGVIEESVGILLLVFLTVLMFIGAFGLLLYLFRKTLLRRLFGFAQVQVERFAEPLVEVARSTIDGDAQSAAHAARELVQLTLARYAWLSARRWIIGSLTGLIAAMAALAGTAMLYRQNQLLQDQSVLLAEQNERIDQQIVQIEEQIKLDNYSVQLAEAARNSELVVEITSIASELGRVVDRQARQGTGDGKRIERTIDGMTPVIDPLRDLDFGLILRIGAASRATKPYRFLDVGASADDNDRMIADAIARRADDLPLTYARITSGMQAVATEEGPRLIDRPASPERGQLLTALTLGGVRAFEVLGFYGLDLSFAYAPGIWLMLPSFQVARLSYADLSFSEINGGDFGGAHLENARFRNAVIRNTTFAAIPGGKIKPPYGHDIDFYRTFMNGADFSNAFVSATNFSHIHALSMNFDAALLVKADFTDADMSATTFRGTVLLEEIFKGADLRSVDFDGAIVIGSDFLTRTEASAKPLTFRAERFQMVKVDLDTLINTARAYLFLSDEDAQRYATELGTYRIDRVQPFEN